MWVHASSLGEFEQGRELIERLRREQPQQGIVLSFFSPSGYNVRKAYDKVDAVCYLPFDLPHLVREFLDVVRPSMALFVKYEFWGNYLSELQRRQVPTYIISAIFRPGQIFFRPWGGMFRNMLRCFTHIYVQNQESRQLLASVGITAVTVAGDTRFDRVTSICNSAREVPVVQAFTASSNFSLVIGSSWQPDEDIILPYFNAHPEMKLIVVPHEFDEHRLAALRQRITRPTGFYTSTTPEQAAGLDCLIVDCFGLLSSIYRYCQAAHVGGGFGAGIHNINEAAVYGIPVSFGPKHHKFPEATELIAAGAGHCIASAADFDATITPLLTDAALLARQGQAAKDYIHSHIGATSVIYNDLFAPKAQ